MYWTLALPGLGRSLANTAQQYPTYRNRILRLLEPLGAPEEAENTGDKEMKDEPSPESPRSEPGRGMTISLEDVSVHAGGHIILADISLKIAAGEHIAIVGPSGAGKSSLAGLLLGWHRPSVGNVHTDGVPLKGDRLCMVRRETAWVDPSVRLWNRSLIENLGYGSGMSDPSHIGAVIEQADLLNMLEKLPDGLQTALGEGGGLVSGGEGQRVRLGRAMLRPGVRLAILDEPFRGLDREKRRELLARTREHWKDATLIFISHDVEDTRSFERILIHRRRAPGGR